MSKPKSVSIVIPVFNEERTIEEIVKRVEKADVSGLKKQIVLVDDASRDRSPDILQKFAKKHTVLIHPINQGKTAALRTGFKSAVGDVVIVQDADLEYDPDEYVRLLEPILEGKADIVYGSRFAGHGPHRVVFFWHSVGNKLLTTLSNMITNLNLSDMETCYKVFRREVLDGVEIESSRFGFEPEFTVKMARRGKVFYEIGISYYGRSYAEGKKINWRDGFAAIWYLLRFGIFSRG